MRLKSLRKGRNINQSELGELIGCHKNSIGKWENDVILPETPFLLALAELFHVSTDYLLGLSDVRNVPQKKHEPPESTAGKAMDALVQQLANRDADLVLLFTQPFSDDEVDALVPAFKTVEKSRALLAQAKAARSTVPISDDLPLGLANGQDHVG